jgi:hypothetical protein
MPMFVQWWRLHGKLMSKTEEACRFSGRPLSYTTNLVRAIPS